MYINIPFLNFESEKLEIKLEKHITSEGMMKASSEYVIDKNNIHYYLPECTIPRFKAKEFADSHKMRNTNKIENATHIIFDLWIPFKKYSSNSTISYNEYYRFDTSWGVEVIEFFYEHNEISEKEYKRMLVLVKSFPFICMTLAQESAIRAYTWHNYSERLNWQNRIKYYTIFCPTLEEYYNINPDIKFISQKQIQDKISDQAIVINRQKYTELCKLIDTEDSDNVTLAMEIMANSNFKASTVWLFMLLIQRGETMYRLGNTSHANFAHMLYHLSYDKSDLIGRDIGPHEVENVFKILKRDGHFTKKNAEMFLAFYNSSNENNYIQFYTGEMINNELRINNSIQYDVVIDDEDEVQISNIDNL